MKTLNISAQTVNQSTKKAFIPGYQFHIILLAQPKQHYIWCINDFFFLRTGKGWEQKCQSLCALALLDVKKLTFSPAVADLHSSKTTTAALKSHAFDCERLISAIKGHSKIPECPQHCKLYTAVQMGQACW